jgi:hypothetical protein
VIAGLLGALCLGAVGGGAAVALLGKGQRRGGGGLLDLGRRGRVLLVHHGTGFLEPQEAFANDSG